MDETNPYLTPEAITHASTAVNDLRLHSTVGVVLATFFGTLAGGGLLLAMNYWRTKQSAHAWSCLFGAMLLTGIIYIAEVFLPENMPTAAYVIPQLVLAHFVAKHLQGELLDRHRARGGRYSSRWAAVGWGLLCSVVILTPLAVVAYYLPEELLNAL